MMEYRGSARLPGGPPTLRDSVFRFTTLPVIHHVATLSFLSISVAPSSQIPGATSNAFHVFMTQPRRNSNRNSSWTNSSLAASS